MKREKNNNLCNYTGMSKKSQVTFYIIFAAVMLIIFLSYLAIKSPVKESEKTISSTSLKNKESVKNYLELCLKDTTTEGIRFILFQGLYYNVTDQVGYMIDVPLYFDNGTDKVPTKEEVADELEKYILGNHRCYNYSFNGLSIDYGEMSVHSVLGRKTFSTITVNALVNDGSKTENLESVNIEVDFNFEKVFDLIKEFEAKHNENPDYIPLGFLDYLNNKYNTNSTILYIDNETVLYSFDFDVAGERIPLNFAARYDWSDIYG